MSNTLSRTLRITIIGLLAGVAPVASAMGQDMTGGTVMAQPQPVATAQAAEAPGAATAAIDEAARAAAAAEAEAREVRAFDQDAAALHAGQFLWRPERAPSGAVEIVVSLAEQKAYVYRADKLIAVTTVSTGRPGHGTPTGTFPILEKHRTHFSNLYNSAPMPNMQRLTMGGIALHAGQLPGYAASHGCVRLPMEFSRLLFGITRRGERVHIITGRTPSASQALAFVTGRGVSSGMQMASAR